jgi:hypothetical protein
LIGREFNYKQESEAPEKQAEKHPAGDYMVTPKKQRKDVNP